MALKWTFEKLKEEALKYKTRGEFYKNCPSAYQTAHRKGILDEICSHMEYVRIYWTNQMLWLEALKYANRGEFQKNNTSAYNAARRAGILDEICSHMSLSLTEAYTFEELRLEAIKYKSRMEFYKKNPSAYTVAWKRKILDQICSHMKPSRGSSLVEIGLLSIIKNIYPNAKKHKDMRVKIPGKSHIHGFEIDILVGNLGIEFDGKYHHTYEYMRADKGKRLWSDDDVRNYHEIKDSWFASKGIQILHIKERDWNVDRESCIKRCLEFLSQKQQDDVAA